MSTMDLAELSRRERPKMPKALDVCGGKNRKGAFHRMKTVNKEGAKYGAESVFGYLQEDLYGFLTACHYGDSEAANKAMLDYVGMCLRVLNGECMSADFKNGDQNHV